MRRIESLCRAAAGVAQRLVAGPADPALPSRGRSAWTSSSIGPNDFAQSLGYPGQPDHPEVVKTMQEITRRIRPAGRTMQADVMQGAWVSEMLLDAGRRILSPSMGERGRPEIGKNPS